VALRGAEVICMPHAGRFRLWNDTPQSQAAAQRYSREFLKKYALRSREKACFAILADKVGRAGYVDCWPRDSENQPHHAGAALIWGPDGEWIAATQAERIEEEMITATLDARLLGQERAWPITCYAPAARNCSENSFGSRCPSKGEANSHGTARGSVKTDRYRDNGSHRQRTPQHDGRQLAPRPRRTRSVNP
jgi:hypothetical protein